MDEESKRNENRSNDQQAQDDKFAYDNLPKVSSVFASNDLSSSDKPNNILENGSNDHETMRIILPVFLENEQKYAQVERKRKIYSSPAKSMRRFSQDSASFERQINVS